MVEERNRMANRIEELEKKDKISKDRIEELEKKDKISKDKKRKRNDSETIDNKKKNEPNEDEDKSKEEKNKIQEEKNKNEKNKTMPKSELSQSKIIQLNRLDIAIREVDIDSVKGNNWIHDSIIKMYMVYLEKLWNNKELLFMDPAVMQSLKNVDTKEVEEHLSALQLWYKSHINIPISDNDTNLKNRGEATGACWYIH